MFAFLPGVSRRFVLLALAASAGLAPLAEARSVAVRARHGMVISQNALASEVGAAVLREGGNAVDAAVATAFALAVTHPTAGNIGGGGFLVWRPSDGGDPLAYDFRGMAPAARPTSGRESPGSDTSSNT